MQSIFNDADLQLAGDCVEVGTCFGLRMGRKAVQRVRAARELVQRAGPLQAGASLAPGSLNIHLGTEWEGLSSTKPRDRDEATPNSSPTLGYRSVKAECVCAML